MILLCGSILFAQDPYVSAYVGYGLGFPGETVTTTVGTDTISTSTVNKIRLGGGINGGASFGIMIDDGVGFEFNVNYQLNPGNEYSESYEMSFPDGMGGVNKISQVSVVEVNSWSLRFTPSLRLEADMKDSKPFMTIGPAVSISSLTQNVSQTDILTGQIESETSISGALSFGLSASVGYEFELDRDIYLTAAIQGNMGYFKPSKGEYTAYTINGQDVLGDLPGEDRSWEYDTEISSTQDNVLPAEIRDYSSINLLVGVRFVLD